MRASGGHSSVTSWPRRMRPCDSERMRISWPPQPREDSVWTIESGAALTRACAESCNIAGRDDQRKTWSVPDLGGGALERVLDTVELGVDAVLGEELCVLADLDDAAAL